MSETTTSPIVYEVETFCPIFQGFYGTFAGDDVERARDGYRDESDPDYDENFKPYDWGKVTESYSKHYVGEINELLDGVFGTDEIVLTYDRINSPREYNFYNDSIYVNAKISLTAFEHMIGLLSGEYVAEFESYIRDNYTSRDGFWSSYSNDSQDWVGDLSLCYHDPEKLDSTVIPHMIGTVLNFILRMQYEEDTWLFLMEDWYCVE